MDTLAPGEVVTSLLGLVDDQGRLEALQSAAALTADRYSILKSALSEYVVFDGYQGPRRVPEGSRNGAGGAHHADRETTSARSWLRGSRR